MGLSGEKLLVPAIFLPLLALTFKFGTNGVSWFWAGQPVVAVVLAVASAVCWGMIVLSRYRQSKS